MVVTLYLALATLKKELARDQLGHLAPRRRQVRGRTPTIRTKLRSGPLPKEKRTG